MKKFPKYVSVSNKYPYLLNIKAQKASQLIKVLEDFPFFATNIITEIVYICSKEKTNTVY